MMIVKLIGISANVQLAIRRGALRKVHICYSSMAALTALQNIQSNLTLAHAITC